MNKPQMLGLCNKAVKNSKLLCASYSEKGAQLYKVQRFDHNEDYKIEAMQPFNIEVWLFYPESLNITLELQALYENLKDYAYFFNNKTAWVKHYISQLLPIFKKQMNRTGFVGDIFI